MHRTQLVRYGVLGHLGRFLALDGTRYPRGSRVVLRTARGLELGEVLAAAADVPGDGQIVRGMTVEDELLEARLRKNRDAAFEACSRRLAGLGPAATLVDVEHLFDGQTLVFYFLGGEPPGWDALTDELAELYEGQAQFRAFVETLTHGCGPDCGTESASGHGCSSCAVGCAVAGACAPVRSKRAEID